MNRLTEFASGVPATQLSDADHQTMQFAASISTQSGYPTDAQTLEKLGVSAPVFYQRMVRLMQDPNASAHYPDVVAHYRSMRDSGINSANPDSE